jgi:hypothetical protein
MGKLSRANEFPSKGREFRGARSRRTRSVKVKLHSSDSLWIRCTTSCTVNPQRIERVEFELYEMLSLFVERHFNKPTMR